MDFRKVRTRKIIPHRTILVSGISLVRKINILLWVCKTGKIIYQKTDEWYIKWQWVVQWVATNENEWKQMTKSDSDWQGMTTSGTMSDNEWQQVTIVANFSFFFFQIREEPTTKHSKENSLNLEEDLWRRPIELRAETSTQEEILTVRSRNCRSSCSQIFIKISGLENFAICIGKQLCWSPFSRKLQVLKRAILLKGDSNTGVFLWTLQNF